MTAREPHIEIMAVIVMGSDMPHGSLLMISVVEIFRQRISTTISPALLLLYFLFLSCYT